MQISPGRAGALAGLLTAVIAGPVGAGPWLDPGDAGLRHDIELLADAGVLPGPVTAWPLSWGDISAALLARPDELLGPAEEAALARLNRRERIGGVGQGRWSARVRGGTDGMTLRGFEDTPREEAEAGATWDWTGNRFAAHLSGQVVTSPEDDREFRADGSVLGIVLGNWMLAGSLNDRWWGPGWQNSLILSSNARPIPAFTIDRNSTAPFETKWLSWIGHWDLTALFGFLEHDRAVPDARYFGMRFTTRPARFLEIGLSRTAMWCGEGRPCGWDTFSDLFLGNDNKGENVAPEDEPGNQMAGYDLRLNAAQWGIPVALYVQRIGEDEQDLRPSLFLTQAGVQAWGAVGSDASWRAFLEVADTLCGANITGDGKANCAYNHPIYATGMRYRGRPIGHSGDNDAEIWNLGLILEDSRDRHWQLTLSAGDLNREGEPDPANTVTAVAQDYRAITLVHRRGMPVGELQALAGVETFEDVASGERDDDWLLQLSWQVNW